MTLDLEVNEVEVKVLTSLASVTGSTACSSRRGMDITRFQILALMARLAQTVPRALRTLTPVYIGCLFLHRFKWTHEFFPFHPKFNRGILASIYTRAAA